MTNEGKRTAMSRGTSGEAFSDMVKLAEVWRMKKFAMPISYSCISGTCRSTSLVTTWHPLDKGCIRTML